MHSETGTDGVEVIESLWDGDLMEAWTVKAAVGLDVPVTQHIAITGAMDGDRTRTGMNPE